MNEAVTQRKLAEEIIVAVKSRLFDLSEFKILKVALDDQYSHLSFHELDIRLPNGESLRITLGTPKAGAK